MKKQIVLSVLIILLLAGSGFGQEWHKIQGFPSSLAPGESFSTEIMIPVPKEINRGKPRNGEPKPVPKTCWEYKFVPFWEHHTAGREYEDYLNGKDEKLIFSRLGDKGWEFINEIPLRIYDEGSFRKTWQYIFKRPKPCKETP